MREILATLEIQTRQSMNSWKCHAHKKILGCWVLPTDVCALLHLLGQGLLISWECASWVWGGAGLGKWFRRFYLNCAWLLIKTRATITPQVNCLCS